MLWQRLLFGGLMIGVVVGVVWADAWVSGGAAGPGAGEEMMGAGSGTVWRGGPIVGLVVLLVVLSSFEMGGLCRAGGYRPTVAWAAFVGAGLALAPWIEMQQRTIGARMLLSSGDGAMELSVLWLTGGMAGAGLLLLARKTTERFVANVAVTGLIVFYLGLLGSFMVRIRCLEPGPAGSWLVVYVILTIKAGDIGAYFTGRAVGRTKLAPWLSPGKTVEGVGGALVLAAGVAVGGMAAWRAWAGEADPAPLNLLQALVFGLVMAIIGHLGDLVESAMKRDLGTKDSGRLVPSFGGLLDVVDSPLFAAPVAWWLLTFWGRMG